MRNMAKIGQFIYPWGNGHYSRMMRLNEKLKEWIKLLEDDAGFLAKIESVRQQLIALGEE